MPEANILHPYYPRNLSLPHYVPNDKSLLEILGLSSAVVAVFVVVAWLYSGSKKHLRGCYLTRVKICWFVVCFLIHGIMEGYFSAYHKTLAGQQSYLAQMWKEYSKADSRYLSSDTFTVCMETITAVIDAPLALLAAYSFLQKTSCRHVIQLTLSLCQIYGDVLYFTTEVKDGFPHGEMWHPLHFWVYFIFLNSLWIVIPLACVVESWLALCNGQRKADLMPQRVATRHKKRN